MNFLAIVNTVIFLSISLLHFYWAAVGKCLMGRVFPSLPEKEVLFTPGKVATVVVAAGLLLFAFISFSSTGIFSFIGRKVSFYGNLVIGLIFLLRAIGDLNMSGLGKRSFLLRLQIMTAGIILPSVL